MVSIIGFNIESGCNQTQYSGKQQIYRIFNLMDPGDLKMSKNKSKGLPLILI